jgi:cytochrome c5
LRHELNGYDGMPPFGCLAEWASEEGINIFNR